jgi:hypothetical protein
MCDGDRARLEDWAAAERERLASAVTGCGADSAVEMETPTRFAEWKLAGSGFNHAGCNPAGDSENSDDDVEVG